MRPRDVLDRPQELLAQAVKHGNSEDIALLLDHVGEDALRTQEPAHAAPIRRPARAPTKSVE